MPPTYEEMKAALEKISIAYKSGHTSGDCARLACAALGLPINPPAPVLYINKK